VDGAVFRQIRYVGESVAQRKVDGSGDPLA
jgi:hypothetical protein